jgi:hypothetical protein
LYASTADEGIPPGDELREEIDEDGGSTRPSSLVMMDLGVDGGRGVLYGWLADLADVIDGERKEATRIDRADEGGVLVLIGVGCEPRRDDVMNRGECCPPQC